MPGNRQAYDQAMNAGHIAAWDQEWQQAIAAYGRAIQEFPEDAEAHLHLGLGLLEIGRLDDALKVYTRARQLNPSDPIPLEKSADVLERMGRLREAANQYVSVADIHLAQRDLNSAIANWERATRLTPALIPIHAKLAQAYERIGDNKKAIREYLALAYNFQRTNDSDKAIKATQRALRIEKGNAQILNTLRALEAGGRIMPPAEDGGQPIRAQGGFDRDAKAKNKGTGKTGALQLKKQETVQEADPLGPLGEAMTESLSRLALYIMEGGALNAAPAALEAMEYQRQGLSNEAITAYRTAQRSLKHPALNMNLGGLLLMNGQPEESTRELNAVLDTSQLATGALHGLGQAYVKLNRQKQASVFLLRALSAADVLVTSDIDDSPELAGIYRELGDTLRDSNEETLTLVNRRLLSFLEGKEWRHRLPDVRRQLEETLREQGMEGVLDILTAQHGDKLTDTVTRIDRYLRQNLYTLAMDEAHRAIEFSPNYLPVHVRMAEIMMREGRVRNAIQKYNVVAKTFLSRGENERAAQILANVLELAPLDVSVRESLIELLDAEERYDEALDQYIDLADAHHQLGNFDLSRDTYQMAERIAGRVNASPEKIVRIKHRIADIDQVRLDLRKAQKTYEEIIAVAPDDERAHRMLVDLAYRLNNPVDAVRRLDKLLGIYARQKQVSRITQLLEELVTVYPNDTGLRSRLASIYRQLGRKRDSIMQLDALGELQLEAGNHKDAANTIRQIIALNPEQVEAYRQLLGQLGG